VHESESAPSHHFTATQQFSRAWNEANIQRDALAEPN
jgi:hypothetical protein